MDLEAGADDTTYWVDGEQLTIETLADGTRQVTISGMTGLALTYLDESDPDAPVYTKIDTNTIDNLGTVTIAWCICRLFRLRHRRRCG